MMLCRLLYDTNSFTVINALNNFANITLSSLYFDITKDSLYANNVKSRERRAIVTVLEQVYIISGVHSIYFLTRHAPDPGHDDLSNGANLALSRGGDPPHFTRRWREGRWVFHFH